MLGFGIRYNCKLKQCRYESHSPSGKIITKNFQGQSALCLQQILKAKVPSSRLCFQLKGSQILLAFPTLPNQAKSQTLNSLLSQNSHWLTFLITQYSFPTGWHFPLVSNGCIYIIRMSIATPTDWCCQAQSTLPQQVLSAPYSHGSHYSDEHMLLLHSPHCLQESAVHRVLVLSLVTLIVYRPDPANTY